MVGLVSELAAQAVADASEKASTLTSEASGLRIPLENPFADDPDLPPISCAHDDNTRAQEVLELRAAGEKAQGRKSGPGIDRLRNVLGDTKKLPKENLRPHEDMKERIVSENPWKIEKVFQGVPGKKSVQAPKRARLPTGPSLPNRHELLYEGPLPIEKRVGELAAHTYYLWGDAKYVSYLCAGTSLEQLSHRLEQFAKKADTSVRKMVHALHIPVSNAPPNLPMLASCLPPALGPPPSAARRPSRPGQAPAVEFL